MRMKTTFVLPSGCSHVNLTVDGDSGVAVKFRGGSGSGEIINEHASGEKRCVHMYDQ